MPRCNWLVANEVPTDARCNGLHGNVEKRTRRLRERLHDHLPRAGAVHDRDRQAQAVRDRDVIVRAFAALPDPPLRRVRYHVDACGDCGDGAEIARPAAARVDRKFFAGGFSFGISREIDVGYATVRATRLTYVGELGWELYVPVEFAVGVYELLMAAGKELGIANAGYYAIDSLRLEKGYRAWGRELSPDINPYEAGLGFAVKLDKPGGFRGRDALAAVDPTRRQAASRLTRDRCTAYKRLGQRIDSAQR